MYHPRYKGTHYESGLNYGKLLFKNGVNLLKFAKLPDDQFAFGKKCIAECQRYFPEILEQIRGMSEGLQIDYQQFAAWLFCIYCYTKDNWCTTMVFKDKENIFFARNSDFATVIKNLIESGYYNLNSGYAFIGNSTTFIQIEDGVNEHGLAVGLNFIIPKSLKPGLNAGFLVRYLLEKCKNVEESITALKNLPISSAQIITMIDRTGAMVSIECNCEKIIFRYPVENQNFLVAANDYITEEMQAYRALDIPDTIFSKERYLTGVTALIANSYSLSFAKELLKGKFGFMCQYDYAKGFDTIWSSIYDLKNNKVYRAEGNPSRTSFKEDLRLKLDIPKIEVKES